MSGVGSSARRQSGSGETGDHGPLELIALLGDSVRVYPLPARGEVTVGRSPENAIYIDHPSVSRRHARIVLDPPLCVEDLGSANGTLVRDSQVPGNPALTPNKRNAADTVDLHKFSGERMLVNEGDFITFGAITTVVRRAQPAVTSGGAAFDQRGIIVCDAAMKALYEEARLAAKSRISVLVLGETGVGKEVVANFLHASSPRAGRPLLGLNCAALPESLLESELFGHEKGAFTGAMQGRAGLFESAEGGTVFLDEVGEMPMSIQTKLLRVLEERQVLRVGGRAPRAVDVRFVTATNRDLQAEIARGAFRQDLFFRLDGMTLTVPPLRERASEIEPLARAFIEKAAQQLEKPAAALALDTRALLLRYRWPGNVRELRNVIDRAVVLCTGDTLRPDHLPPRLRESEDAMPTPVETPVARIGGELSERERILATLEACAGNQTQAALRLGISRRTLVSRLGEYDVPRPRKRP